ncbi:hypothetical protein FB45DRAFT_950898 [Roridomyces roridus]|uniref:F-box domain-containing protein n=1 Tax=Roridomyces roridus TaxID=1738132 RepID=A0AAD7B0J0_9AGAR|nr:hypothetical protein FB45DRAFT_950898 [Roridomyces roridus]
MLCVQCGAAVDVTSAKIPPTTSYSIRNELLTSNLCPLESEVPYIERIIEDHQPRVNALNAQIDILQTALARFVRERNGLVSRAERYRAVLAPIRRLPPELVAEILKLVPFTRGIAYKTIEQPPWTLGHICRSWRETLLQCPLLWRRFTFTASPAAFPPDMIETQLLRAAHSPLAIDFEWDKFTWTSDDRAGVLWNPLLLHSSRWQSLRIRCHDQTTSDIILQLLEVIKGRIPQLEKVEFCVKRRVRPASTKEWDMFSIAPQLSEFLTTEALWDGYSPHFSIPWTQIRRYRGVYSSTHQLDILRKAPNLVDCSIGFDVTLATHGDVMLVLPPLRRLLVEGTSILDHLTAPSLELLVVRGAGPNLLSCIQRSSCNLTTLGITRNSSFSGLIELLKSCPLLTHLFLSSGDVVSSAEAVFMEPLFTGLHVSDSASDTSTSITICPNIEYFGFLWVDDSAFPAEESFFRMIHSRCGPSPSQRLRSIRLLTTFNRGQLVSQTFRDEMRRLEREGRLDVDYFDEEEADACLAQL